MAIYSKKRLDPPSPLDSIISRSGVSITPTDIGYKSRWVDVYETLI
jgi:hypothetical protein